MNNAYKLANNLHCHISKFSLVLGLIWVVNGASGQNLVPNPSFENVVCSAFVLFPGLNALHDWDYIGYDRGGGSAAFFPCPAYPNWEPPFNGNQGFQYTKHGEAHIQLKLLDSFGAHGLIAMFCQLQDSLLPDCQYYASFHVSPHNRPLRGLVVQELGIKFLHNLPDTTKLLHEQAFYAQGYDVVSQQGWLDDTSRYTWTKVGGTFVPDDVKHYLSLGIFNDRINVKRRRLNGDDSQTRYFIDAVTVIAHPSLPHDTTLCQGQGFWLKPHMPPGAEFEWFDQSTQDSIYVDQPGHYWAMSYSQFDTTFDTIEVLVETNPVSKDTHFCQGDSVLVDLQLQHQTSIRWEDGNTKGLRYFKEEGQYGYTLNNSSCTYTDTVHITQIPAPPPLPKDTSHCESLLLGQTNLQHTLKWSTGANTPQIRLDTSLKVWRTATLQACAFIDTVDVSVYPQLDDQFIDTTICQGEQMDLRFDQLAYQNIQESVLTVNQPQEWQLWFFDGCDTNTLFIDVTESHNCQCFLFVANAFSPDNDGVNDSFYPKTNCELISLKIEIYNRWGQRIYTSTEKHGWLGENAATKGLYLYRFKAVLSNGGRKQHFSRSGGVYVK